MQERWKNDKCLHPSIRDQRECAVCGAEVRVWQMMSLARQASEAKEMRRLGSETLFLNRRDAVFDELVDVGDALR